MPAHLFAGPLVRSSANCIALVRMMSVRRRVRRAVLDASLVDGDPAGLTLLPPAVVARIANDAAISVVQELERPVASVRGSRDQQYSLIHDSKVWIESLMNALSVSESLACLYFDGFQSLERSLGVQGTLFERTRLLALFILSQSFEQEDGFPALDDLLSVVCNNPKAHDAVGSVEWSLLRVYLKIPQWPRELSRVSWIEAHRLLKSGINADPESDDLGDLKTLVLSGERMRAIREDRGKDFVHVVRIEDCINATMSVYVRSGITSISNCRNCKIRLGVCRGVLVVRDCDKLELTGICTHLRISRTLSSSFFLYTTMSPILLAGSADIRLGPYNSGFGTLPAQLREEARHFLTDKEVFLQNKWNNPITFEASSTAESTSTISYTIIEPEDFFTTFCPFEIAGDDMDRSFELPSQLPAMNPFAMPDTYAQILLERKRRIDRVRKTVEDAVRKAPEKAAYIQRQINMRFHAWLENSGYDTIVNAVKNTASNSCTCSH